jgi:hypothetical protein
MQSVGAGDSDDPVDRRAGRRAGDAARDIRRGDRRDRPIRRADRIALGHRIGNAVNEFEELSGPRAIEYGAPDSTISFSWAILARM